MKRKHASKLTALIIYLIAFYAIWTAWELWVKPWIGIAVQNEYIARFIKSGLIKNLVWTLPALLLIKRFEGSMYVGLKNMFTTKVRWARYLPVFLLFMVYLIAGAILTKGKLAISETFGFADVIVVLFVGITEETVFRGWLLNAAVNENRKWLPVIVNALLFLLIHFPVWIYKGEFAVNFQNFGFVSVLVLSGIFSWTFIKSKNILIPIFLHMYWDLMIMMLY